MVSPRLARSGLLLAVSIILLSASGCTSTAVPGDTTGSSKAADPTFDPAACAFWESAAVRISCATRGAVIHYTTNASTPSPTTGLIYTDRIVLTRTTTIQAIACADGLDPSSVVSATFAQAAPDTGMSIVQPVIDGSLQVAQTTTLTLSCATSACGCIVQSVWADLSSIGGPPSQPLLFLQDRWVWSGSITPTADGAKTIVLTARDNSRGVQVTVDLPVTVAPVHQPPAATSPLLIGDLAQGRKGFLTATCAVDDPDGKIVDATADFSAVGGSANAHVCMQNDQLTICQNVIPLSPGEKTIAITLTDDKGASTTVSGTVTVEPGNAPPTITSPSLTGNLVSGQPAAITVLCGASDANGVVDSVRVDLSPIGGPKDQDLTDTGSGWVWSGTVIPPADGVEMILFTATDNEGCPCTGNVQVYVADSGTPSGQPTGQSVSNASVTGTLILGQESTVTVSCQTGSMIQSVSANLVAIGGLAVQPLACGTGDSWAWTGTVTPAQSRSACVALTAVDSSGETTIGTTIARVYSSWPGSLAGVWSGKVSHQVGFSIVPGERTCFVMPFTMAFLGNDQPSRLPLFFGMSTFIWLPTDTLWNAGDQGTFTVSVDRARMSPCIISTVVGSMSRSATSFSADMDLTLGFPTSAQTGHARGPILRSRVPTTGRAASTRPTDCPGRRV